MASVSTYQDYLKAQQRHETAQAMIERASNLTRHEELLDSLQEQDQKKTQRQQQRTHCSKNPRSSMRTFVPKCTTLALI